MKKNWGITGAALVFAAAALWGGCTHTGTEQTRSTGEKIDDRTIARQVKSALKDDSLLKGTDITVSSYRGDVVLGGYVDHPMQRDRASQITRVTPGVHWFQNQVVVKGSSPYARMTSTITNTAVVANTNVWERGTMDYYGRPPAETTIIRGSESSVHQGTNQK